MNYINRNGELFTCKDYYLLFFTDKELAEEYSVRYMGDDFFMTLDEARYELGDFLFSSGIGNMIDVYRPSNPILLIDIEEAKQQVWKQEKVLCNVIWGEKVGWIPLHLGSFEKYFTRITY